MATAAPFRLILASASPRRSELLRNAGIPFVVQPANLEERLQPGETPRDFALRVATEKARAVHGQHPSEVVLGADTIVVIDGEILGKPRDAADAARMLRRLAGRGHEVLTGVCLAGPRFEDARAETTQVFMGPLNEAEIEAYILSGEPMDKAGAYAIQGRASRWIPKIVGCYFNVVGLPVPLVTQMLRARKLL